MAYTFTQEEGNQFILECHHDAAAVGRKLASNPALAQAVNPVLGESALGAAGHMGRADIAELLLTSGAKLELAAAAMLGRRDVVREALDKDPKLAHSGGAHNIPLAFHAALSGDIELMQMLWDAGAQAEVKHALLGAVMKNRLPLAAWLLEHGASKEVETYDGKSPLELAEQMKFSEMAELLDRNQGRKLPAYIRGIGTAGPKS